MRAGAPVLGVCGGYQLLGRTVSDDVESRRGTVAGLGLLPVTTTFATDKVLARPSGRCSPFGDVPAAGYEIHHGRTTVHGGAPLLRTAAGADEGCVDGAVLGTSWHGLLENDELRRALLAWVAERRGLAFVAGTVSFAAERERVLDTVGDLVADHADTAALGALIAGGVPAGPADAHQAR